MEFNWNRLIAGLIAFLLVLLLLPRKAQAASSGEIRGQINTLKQQQTELRDEISQLQTEYDKNRNDVLEIVRRKNLVEQEISNLHHQVSNVQSQLDAYRTLIADSQGELDAAKSSYDAMNTASKVRIRAVEENPGLSYWQVLFRADSFSDFLDRLNMVTEIAASDQRRLAELTQAYQAVCAAQDTLNAEKAEVEQTQQELDLVQTELEQKQKDADAILQELMAKGTEIQALREQLDQEDASLLDEIAKAEKEYHDAKHREWLEYMESCTTVPPETTLPSSPTEPDNGSSETNWLRPCSYRYLSSPFGLRESPTTGASTYHQGVDLAAPKGTPVYAARSGVVTRAGYSSSAGYLVSINHGDGYSSVYMHMTTYAVSVSTAVSAGQLIGYVGNTGIATGYHLHFGIAYNGSYINPCTLISF